MYPAHCLAPPSPPCLPQCSNQSSTYGNLPRGLCTPPTDEDMGTTYELPHLPSCDNYPLHHVVYAPTMSQTERRRSALNERPAPALAEHVLYPIQTRASNGYRPVAAPPTSLPVVAQPTADEASLSRAAPPQARPSALTTGISPTHSEQSAASAKMTHHSMRIPQRISKRGGSISDFMAQVAALFWFESTKLLDRVEDTHANVPVQPLPPTAVASQHFKKWVSSVLNTTQVTQNVVILALLYIYRLKKANPTVKGRSGSEYRLLTVALMLGNKFLDDNTYTNRTWADVSGISVNEIHVMEVEFLSNMRYSLLVSADEWEQWLDRLARFWSYLELAQHAVSPSPSPLLIPSPGHHSVISPLPSPTAPLTPNLQSASHSFSLQSPHLAPLGNGSQPWTAAPYGGSNAASPLALKPEPLSYRKRRSPEEELAEPPAKRVSHVAVGQRQPATRFPAQAALNNPAAAPQALRLVPSQSALVADQVRPPVPSLTLNTAQAADLAGPPVQPHPAPGYAASQVAPLSLPPLNSGIRAMAMVFPTTAYAPPQAIPAPCGAVTPTSSFPQMTYATPTKRLSPQSTLAAYPGSSPLVMTTPAANVGTTSGLHTPISHSPSIYLQQRNSPYKPVRHVNTLLYPPPSAFLQQYHLPNPVLPNQMHYQPLGKRNEYRTGIVPEFLDAFQPAGLVSGAQPYSFVPGPYQQQQPLAQVLPIPHPHVHQPRAQHASQPTARPAPSSYPAQY